MSGQYNDPMFRVLYPPNWTVEESGDELDRMVEIEAPGGMAHDQHPFRLFAGSASG
jgi:hypothetical protein